MPCYKLLLAPVYTMQLVSLQEFLNIGHIFVWGVVFVTALQISCVESSRLVDELSPVLWITESLSVWVLHLSFKFYRVSNRRLFQNAAKNVNSADNWCYVCGEVTFSSQNRSITPVIRKAYHCYLGARLATSIKSRLYIFVAILVSSRTG